MTTPPRSIKALEMLLKLRKSSCCCGSDCRAAMFSRIRAAAWGGDGGRGSGLCLEQPPTPRLGNLGTHLDAPAVAEHFLVLGCGLALTQGPGGPDGKRETQSLGYDPGPGPPCSSRLPRRRRLTWTEPPPWRRGQWHYLPGAAARTVHLSGRWHRVGGGALVEGEGKEQGWGGGGGSLTDNILLVFYQLHLHHGGKLLQSLHCLRRWGRCPGLRAGPTSAALDAGCRLSPDLD